MFLGVFRETGDIFRIYNDSLPLADAMMMSIALEMAAAAFFQASGIVVYQ